jgi:hypothetical protein
MRQVRRESQRSYLGRPVVRLTSKPDSDVRLRRQESAEAILPMFFFREGPNIETLRVSKMSSSQDEHRRPNTSDRGTTAQTKWVKPMGVVERVEPFSARDRRKSSARVSALLSMNRPRIVQPIKKIKGGHMAAFYLFNF